MNLQDLSCDVDNLNLRREKAGKKNGPLAIDVSLSGKANVDQLHGLFSTKVSFDRLLGNLYDKDLELRTSDVGAQRLSRIADGVLVTFTPIAPEASEDDDEEEPASPVRIAIAKVDSIAYTPKPAGIVDFSLRVQFRVDDDNLLLVAALLRTQVVLSVQPRQASLQLDSRPTDDAPLIEEEQIPLDDSRTEPTIEEIRANEAAALADKAPRAPLTVAVSTDAPASDVLVPGQRKGPQRPKKAAAAAGQRFDLQ